MTEAASPDEVVIVEPAGAITSRAAGAFERDLLAHLNAGSRWFIVDFAQVELITSAAIRVLLMLDQRLPAVGGRLVLCAMSTHVEMVFEVAGLKPQFRIASSREDALAQVAVTSRGEPRTTVGASKLTRQVGRLVGSAGGASPAPGGTADTAGPSALTHEVARLLGWSGTGDPGTR